MTQPTRTVTPPARRSGSPRRAGPRRRWSALVRALGLPLIGLAGTVAVWWSAVVVFDIRQIFLPSPPDIIAAYADRPDYMLAQTWDTISATLQGYTLAVVAGLALAVVVTASDTVNRALLPQIVAINSIPKVAIAPLLIVWVGYDAWPRVMLLSFLISFFPIMVAAMAGLTSVPADLSELSRSLSASRLHTFVKVRFPWAMPQIFVGLKLGITLAVIGTVVAEMQSSNDGLGATVKNASASSNTPRAFAAIIILMFLSVSLFYLVVALERLMVPWARAISK